MIVCLSVLYLCGQQVIARTCSFMYLSPQQCEPRRKIFCKRNQWYLRSTKALSTSFGAPSSLAWTMPSELAAALVEAARQMCHNFLTAWM